MDTSFTQRRQSLFFLAAAIATAVFASASDPSSSIPQTSVNSPPLEFASPLQSFTIFDKKTLDGARANSPRAKFLPRFRAGLAAEQKIRDRISEEKKLADLGDDDEGGLGGGGANWAEMSAAADVAERKKEERRLERAYDRATTLYDEKSNALSVNELDKDDVQSGKYQFVGVVNTSSSGKKGKASVTWYARKKPKGSKWSVRMIRADRDAIARDLHVRGKIDVYGQYVNKGVPVEQRKLAKERGLGVDERPVLEGKYSVRERSWRTLWNFNPKRFFSDSSGMFWRERRLSPGLYTDGRVVFESVYRYRDGKNGMKPVSLLSQFLDSPAVEDNVKEKIMVRLKVDSPDVVIED
mmetsp:Transcript_9766/g.13670  ORF Transcript_9766/g.13670 Transcript_9766/m.13670 type:complete len:353 (-) Transcript_9766:152-1210(-)|eukprot:CAMPEP_0185729800 /NCGR_PEP_ID=MMETSP1171-20130828/7346_1 /TAXON_ID=374046 /ORGANISM="Helicotheca tamensis, Strain CCMP826" /LENGTH=352 /DNA_ID=CAMNT_0028398719 /DNA_START=144 /DNA_END=1202 /DNA_ORIENTATION=+